MDPLTPVHLTPLLLIHGLADADPVVSAEAAERLATAGVDVEARFEPGLGHTISQVGATEAGRSLAGKLGFGPT